MLFALLTSSAASAAVKRTFVQKRFLGVTAGSSVSVKFPKPNVAGNLIVAYVVWDGAGTATVADGAGNTYATAVGPTTAPDGTNAAIFYAANVAAGANTLTATFSAPVATRGALYVHEYSGLAQTAPLGATSAAAG